MTKESKPIVTEEMLVGACRAFFGDEWSFAEAEGMREALEAALAVSPAQELLESVSGPNSGDYIRTDTVREYLTGGAK